MALQGDLATLDLTGVLQSLEQARKSGVLAIQDGREVTRMAFVDGRLSALSYPGRSDVARYLAAAGVVTNAQLERASKSARGKRSTCAALIESGAVQRESLVELVRARLTDEACEVLMTRSGRFQFDERAVADDSFDRDEIALGIALPASPLLLETARRADHWTLIRERLPSESAHYELARQPKPAADATAAALQERVCALLDGTRSIAEVAAHFPHLRFQVYELLAHLAESRAIRRCEPGDLAKRVQELAPRDAARARELLERGLELDPHNLTLLSTQALLAEQAGDLERASEALKLVVHFELERGGAASARSALERLKTLDADDLFVWEKSFDLAVSEHRTLDALADGKRLVELYRGPGLHRKAATVIERVLTLGGSSWELVCELARLRTSAGDTRGALDVLHRYGAERLGEQSFALAKRAYDEILAIDPRDKRAKLAAEEIASGELVRRRAKWRRIRRRAALAVFAVFIAPWLGYEALARRAHMDATRRMLRENWIEEHRFDEAIGAYKAVADVYRWSSVAWYDAPQSIAELEAKRDAAGK